MSEASEQTQFKIGNSAWKARSSHGRKPIFKNAEALHSACLQYLQWCEDNPLMAVELVKYQGRATQVQLPRMRAMTITGLCNILDISASTWSSFRAKPDFLEVIEWVEGIIYQMKFEGAAADMLNANIIGRELGLAEKPEANAESMADVLRELASKLPDLTSLTTGQNQTSKESQNLRKPVNAV